MLLGISDTSELAFLDGSGDTPLHTLISRQGDHATIAALIEAVPGAALLYRENAVGRTPAEVARDAYVASRIKEPGYQSHVDLSVSTLVTKAPEEFLPEAKEKALAAKWGRKRGANTDKVAEIWNIVSGFIEKGASAEGKATEKTPKRRLVSLHEANDVARRLGAQHQGERYGVQTKKKEGEEAEPEQYDVVAAKYSLEYLAWKEETKDDESVKEGSDDEYHECDSDCDSDCDE